MELLRTFRTRTEEEVEMQETSYSFSMECNVECESTKILLQLGFFFGAAASLVFCI